MAKDDLAELLRVAASGKTANTVEVGKPVKPTKLSKAERMQLMHQGRKQREREHPKT